MAQPLQQIRNRLTCIELTFRSHWHVGIEIISSKKKFKKMPPIKKKTHQKQKFTPHLKNSRHMTKKTQGLGPLPSQTKISLGMWQVR